MSGEQDDMVSRDQPPSGGGVREIVLGGVRPSGRTVNLRDLGFVGTVSDAALAEIEAAERRALRVLTTAHRYRFGGGL